jgi:hypothetical protein
MKPRIVHSSLQGRCRTGARKIGEHGINRDVVLMLCGHFFEYAWTCCCKEISLIGDHGVKDESGNVSCRS